MSRRRGGRHGRGLLIGTGLAAGVAGAAAATLRRAASRPAREAAAALRGGPFLIAHRGGAGLYPENTIPAFKRSVAEWASDMIELDVRASADGECIVIHDPTVDRTTDGTGAVSGMTLAELRRLDAGYRFTPDGGRTYPFRGQGIRIPTIEEVLDAVSGTRLVVEVKTGAAQQSLLDAVRRTGAESRVVAAGGHERDRALFGGYPGAISATTEQCARFYALHRVRLSRLWRIPADAVHVPETWGGHRIVTPRFIHDIHAQGLSVHVWTVNRTEDMVRLAGWGVDGLITDRPDLLADVLTELHGRPPAPARGGARQAAESLE